MATSGGTTTGGSGNSRLLSIAAELRNAIYTAALVTDVTITFDRDNHKQPALLKVSKQVRAEAAPIYYQENTFIIDSSNYNPKALNIFVLQSRPWLTTNKNVEIGAKTIDLVWDNVLQWARAVHAACAPGLGEGDDSRPSSCKAVTLILLLARDLRSVPWDTARQVLVAAKEISELDRLEWK